MEAQDPLAHAREQAESQQLLHHEATFALEHDHRGMENSNEALRTARLTRRGDKAARIEAATRRLEGELTVGRGAGGVGVGGGRAVESDYRKMSAPSSSRVVD